MANGVDWTDPPQQGPVQAPREHWIQLCQDPADNREQRVHGQVRLHPDIHQRWWLQG